MVAGAAAVDGVEEEAEEDDESAQAGSYNYLLNMAIHSLTREKVQVFFLPWGSCNLGKRLARVLLSENITSMEAASEPSMPTQRTHAGDEV